MIFSKPKFNSIRHGLIASLSMATTFVFPLVRPALAGETDWFRLAHFYHSEAPKDAHTDLSKQGTRTNWVWETDPAKIIARSNAVRKYALEQGMIDTSMINWVHWIRDWGNGLERSAQNPPPHRS